tara:strand:+ start:683 stop:1519 length:837 start_codon:yes stop_codon:yes gene_type:complete
MFKGRRLVIATKHKKEKVIAPLLEDAFNVSCFIIDSFDTDILGTFTGEIKRELDPISTARQKCLMAMEASNCDLGIASEGSFGAHPSIVFACADDEFLIFIDKKNDLEIIARELSLETNFNAKKIKSEKDLFDFAKAVNFPSHGLILRTSKNDNTNVIKGITDQTQLQDAFKTLIEATGYIYAETDMRALYNPSRMTVIETATKKLVDKINSYCPECDTPGFDVTDTKKGLQCDLCGSPTKSILSLISSCKKCDFKKEDLYPHKKTTEDPMYCDYCNP